MKGIRKALYLTFVLATTLHEILFHPGKHEIERLFQQ